MTATTFHSGDDGGYGDDNDDGMDTGDNKDLFFIVIPQST